MAGWFGSLYDSDDSNVLTPVPPSGPEPWLDSVVTVEICVKVGRFQDRRRRPALDPSEPTERGSLLLSCAFTGVLLFVALMQKNALLPVRT